MSKRLLLLPPADPVESANRVGLRYVSDDLPGIQREPAGEDFRYLGPEGKEIDDPATLDRIKSLVIPPAWTDVWICPDPRGHLQATGRDSRGRKQHRYHPRWREVRDETKYAWLIAFARALPAIRQRVDEDLALPGVSRNKVLATVLRLLEVSLIRVGNEEYARENKSYGLTTMENRHVEVSGSDLYFHFRGKSGKEHKVRVHDRRLAKIVKACQDIPGHELFQYIDESGERRKIESEDVNAYLREITAQDFTAKFFRTWAGTVLAVRELLQLQPPESDTAAKKCIAQAIKNVARQLGNTPAVCRKCYVHPAIIECFTERTLKDALDQGSHGKASKSKHDLSAEEAAVLALLEERLSHHTRSSRA